MNTAARMESTSKINMIQCSEETAKLLKDDGKGHWLPPREDVVVAKGKGELRTYWINISKGGNSGGDEQKRASNALRHSTSLDTLSSLGQDTNQAACQASLDSPVLKSEIDGSSSSNKGDIKFDLDKTERLIEWNVQVLSGLLKKILARRLSLGRAPAFDFNAAGAQMHKSPLDEVKDIIELPELPSFEEFKSFVVPDTIQLRKDVVDELRSYVTEIGKAYNNNNPFHSFEHASHVTMSVTKLLCRIVNPKEVEYQRIRESGGGIKQIQSNLHDHTFGLTSDPLIQFACAYSALIHDVDHPGVTNAVLVKEGDPLTAQYGKQSVAEQNSVELAWNLLVRKQCGASTV